MLHTFPLHLYVIFQFCCHPISVFISSCKLLCFSSTPIFSILQLVDTLFYSGFYHCQERMARKVHSHKRSNEGMKTPQNRQELQVETSKIHYRKGELLYSSQVENQCSKNSNSNVASVRKLMNEELFKQSGTRNNAPNLVARLMGLDMMPLDTKSIFNSSYSNADSVRKLMNDELSKQSSTKYNAPNLVARLMGLDMMPLDSKSIVQSDQSTSENMEKKIAKKGMNGRGSSNFNSSSRMEFGSFDQHIDDGGWGQNFRKLMPRGHPQKDELQKFKRELEAYQAAQENLSKEMAQHSATEMMEAIPAKKKEPFPSRNRTQSRDFEESLVMKTTKRLDISSSPTTQITILKPGSDKICDCNYEENCFGSSGALQGRASIEDFLEEVRERLVCELQGKTVNKDSAVRGRGFETPYNERPSNEVDVHLFRSALTRSYTSKIELNGPSPLESINRGTRRLLLERLRNVVKTAVHFDISEVTCRNSNHKVRLKQAEDTMKCSTDTSHHQVLNDENEVLAGSFGSEPDDTKLLQRELSPRNLVRSLSAPISGTSFGRFPLEDRDILRKLEAVETTHADVKKQRKHRFSIKEKVSNFKNRFGLRGKLLVKRIQTMVEPCGDHDRVTVRDIRSGPTVLMKHSERHENFTEAPPSPASVCSSIQEELWSRTKYLSPISAPVASSTEDNVMPEVNRDINLNGLNIQLSQLESDIPQELVTKPEPLQYELIHLEDPVESYIRDLLVASGMYFGSCEKYLSRCDTFTKPIGNSVSEEVEESQKKYLVKENYENKLEHKILLDLLNEALSIVLGPPMTMSRFRRKLNTLYMQPPPCGKELLKLVWDIINVSLYLPSNSSFSLDSLLARDIGSISWCGLINDEINIFETEIACLIIDDLVEEFMKDMCSSYIDKSNKHIFVPCLTIHDLQFRT